MRYGLAWVPHFAIRLQARKGVKRGVPAHSLARPGAPPNDADYGGNNNKASQWLDSHDEFLPCGNQNADG
jgi:hypothetical protein